MTRSLLAEQHQRTQRADQRLERVLAECDQMDKSSSSLVRQAAARIRAAIVAEVAR